MIRIKKGLFLTILFLAGFVAGVVLMRILFLPAQHVRAYRETLHAYREILQRNFVNNQSELAHKAFQEGNNLKAMVHIWTVLEAGPNGSELFNDQVSKVYEEEIDEVLSERFFFVTLPAINKGFKEMRQVKPGEEEARQKAHPHGELAVVLEKLGYKELAREHYLIASRLWNLPEDKIRDIFHGYMKTRKPIEGY